MPKLDRYLSSEFARAVFAALVVLGMVSLGGLFADLLGEMARGKVPPPLLLSQLGLRLVRYLPLILPLALLLGFMLALGRLFLGVGILGGFTTFSSFSLEFWLLFERGQLPQAATYVLASVIVGIAVCGLGMLAMRQLPA